MPLRYLSLIALPQEEPTWPWTSLPQAAVARLSMQMEPLLSAGVPTTAMSARCATSSRKAKTCNTSALTPGSTLRRFTVIGSFANSFSRTPHRYTTPCPTPARLRFTARCVPTIGSATTRWCGCCSRLALIRTPLLLPAHRPAPSCATVAPGAKPRCIGQRQSEPPERSGHCSTLAPTWKSRTRMAIRRSPGPAGIAGRRRSCACFATVPSASNRSIRVCAYTWLASHCPGTRPGE